jgi:hypothetical protein
MTNPVLAFLASFDFVLTYFSGIFIDSIGLGGFVSLNFRFFFFAFLRNYRGLASGLHSPSFLSRVCRHFEVTASQRGGLVCSKRQRLLYYGCADSFGERGYGSRALRRAVMIIPLGRSCCF